MSLRTTLGAVLMWCGLALGAPAVAADWVEGTALLDSPAYRPEVPASFRSVRGPLVTVHGDARHAVLLERLAAHANAAAPRLASALGVPLGDTVDVFLASSEEQFFELQPGRAPDWADGTAWPRMGAIFLRAPGARAPDAAPLTQVLDHEIVHVLLGRAFAPHDPPTWLQEGLAQVYAGEHGPETVNALQASGRARFTLEELDRAFPKDAGAARLAYAQSADFIGWLRANHGDAGIAKLIRGFVRGGDIDAALRDATGQGVLEVQARWLDRLNGIPTSLFGVPLSEAAFAAGGVGLVWTGRRRRRERAARLERRRREEALVDGLVTDLLRGGYLERRSVESA